MEIGLFEVLAVILGVTELVLLYQLRKNRHSLTSYVKSLVLFGILVIPLITLSLGNYHVFVSSKEVDSCMNCHVMRPFGNDMMHDQNSMTLAARHYKNNWIKDQECYSCHKDYGFQGTMKTKADGYRHLMKYITGTYQEPIKFRGEFNSMNCMGCHSGTPVFENVHEHQPVKENLASDNPTLSCLNCHGRAHPERSRRTPGHEDYDELNREYKSIEGDAVFQPIEEGKGEEVTAFIKRIDSQN
ncbi:hypothetical protein R9C00_09355 [Flammeovirgaceae bacterium SG7u.111]|nr:hypothetical protein [Flammeovirgaceae bacterium SG7u.132]WPO37655.1 hypothetical protein R9C00_09355 [Flammeovirgaceae bacterium SG7u.111]